MNTFDSPENQAALINNGLAQQQANAMAAQQAPAHQLRDSVVAVSTANEALLGLLDQIRGTVALTSPATTEDPPLDLGTSLSETLQRVPGALKAEAERTHQLVNQIRELLL